MATFSLAVEDFHHGDDLMHGLSYLNQLSAVTYNLDEGDALDKQCLAWLPLKLDDSAQREYESVKSKTWTEVKVEYSKLLDDPQDRYNWLSGKTKIVWDGKESFHSLSARIKRKVDKSGYPNGKKEQYFFTFRQALTADYRKAIDLHCGLNWSLEEAIKIANRLRLADGNANEATSFSAAAMVDNSGAVVGTPLRKSTGRAGSEKWKKPNISSQFASCYIDDDDGDDQFEDADSRDAEHRDEHHGDEDYRDRDWRDEDHHRRSHDDVRRSRWFNDKDRGSRRYDDEDRGNHKFDDDCRGRRYNNDDRGSRPYINYVGREDRRYDDGGCGSRRYNDGGRGDRGYGDRRNGESQLYPSSSSDEEPQSRQQDHRHYGAAKFHEKRNTRSEPRYRAEKKWS